MDILLRAISYSGFPSDRQKSPQLFSRVLIMFFARFFLSGKRWNVAGLLSGLLLAILSAAAQAQTSPHAPTADEKAAEVKAAWQAGDAAGTRGPAAIALRDQANLQLPENYFFVPSAQGLRIMRAYGNRPNETTFTGLIVGTKAGDDWLVAINFIKDGYIRDDDAKDWNAEDLLTSLKEGTAEGNKERAAKGFPEIEIIGWVEKPAYDAGSHRLVWSMSSKTKGAPDDAARGVNYNTYALGRDGYFSLNLLTGLATIEAQKPIARTLLGALQFQPGKRYEDFNAATDHVAEYGLAALIGVVAAKKLGFIALALAFVVKFAKAIALGAAGIGFAITKIFRRKKSASSLSEASPEPKTGPDAA
jgi:uncharacterized membrane-anchored protein